MIRVAIVSDTHADEASRWEEHEKCMAFIADDVAAREVDLVAHGGDVWERRSTDRERASVGAWVQRVCETAPLVIVAGNHDSQLDVEWLGKLRTRHRAHAFGAPGVVAVGGCVVAALPWPRRGHLLAALGQPVSHEESGAIAQHELRKILLGLGSMMDAQGDNGPRIFLGHVDLDGAKTDHDQPVVGGDMKLSLADLSLVRADFYGMGHIHASATTNNWSIDGAPALYPGAIRHNNFGEAATGKGYVIADFDQVDDAWRCVHWELVLTPCRGMVLAEDEWSSDGWLSGHNLDLTDLRDAEVRFRFHCAADQRDAARLAAEEVRADLLARGAHSVKLEAQVRAVTRARAPEIAAAKTDEERFDAWCRSRGITVGEKRRPGLLARLAEIKGAA